MPPLFSVVIPTFNREAYVGATLDSAFTQEFGDYEVIVVDDGSTDGTLEVVRSYDDRVTLFEQDHKGCAAARNFGARSATGRYLAFLDSDDLWFPWTLAVFAEAIERHGSPAFVGGRLAPFRDPAETRSVERCELVTAGGPDFFSTARRERFGLGVAHGVVSREAYLAVDGCEELNINGTDSDVLLKMGDAPGFAIIKQPVTLAYRQHGGGTTMNFDKGVAGVQMMIRHERTGRYPGGPGRRQERLPHILARARGVTREALRANRPDVAWRIYRETFVWNLRTGRIKYLAATPVWVLWQKAIGARPAMAATA